MNYTYNKMHKKIKSNQLILFSKKIFNNRLSQSSNVSQRYACAIESNYKPTGDK